MADIKADTERMRRNAEHTAQKLKELVSQVPKSTFRLIARYPGGLARASQACLKGDYASLELAKQAVPQSDDSQPTYMIYDDAGQQVYSAVFGGDKGW